ncbi:MAG: hypothetical protein ACI8QC_000097 [Planctomycetota bacterium]|jgi:hypothetical protein
MLYLQSLCLALSLVACSTPERTEPEQAPEAPTDLSGWRSERIALPPEFAPSLPEGEELLLFAPGMFDPQAEDFWSYVFLMQVEWSDVDSHRLTSLFEAYFDGLLLSVAKGSGADIGTNPAHVNVLPIDDLHYSIEVILIDAFGTLETIKLHVLVEVEHEDAGGLLLGVQASPQPSTHPIWRDLSAALGSLSL